MSAPINHSVFNQWRLANGLTVQLVTGPAEGDVLVTSTDSGGSPGELSHLILAAAGIEPGSLPSLFTPPAKLLTHGKMPVLVVQTVGGSEAGSTAHLLADNLRIGLRLLQSVESPAKLRLYLPLLGMGAGELDAVDSARITVKALREWDPGSFGTVFLAAPDATAAEHLSREGIGLVRIARGERGEAVAHVQRLLNLPPDGAYGPKSVAAVESIQRASGLEPDGVIDDLTIALIERHAASTSASTPAPAEQAQARDVDESRERVTKAIAIASHLAEHGGAKGGANAALVLVAIFGTDRPWMEKLGFDTEQEEVAMTRGLAALGIGELPDSVGDLDPKRVARNLDTEAEKAVADSERMGIDDPWLALKAALLVSPLRGGPRSVEPVLDAMGIGAGRVRASLRSEIAHRLEREPRVRARVLDLVVDASARVAGRSVYANDQPSGNDELEIGNDVDALADVIAAEARKPPLAVGLFGDWGSGKSFFINQLQARLDAVTAVARACKATGRPTAYCSRIVHVSFNAWQYIDGNLWANLVHRIFEQLARELFDAEKGQVTEEQRKQLFAKLALSREQLADNERRRAVAQKAVDDAAVRMGALENQRSQASARLETQSREMMLAAVLEAPVVQEVIKAFHEAFPKRAGEDVIRELRQTGDDLGTLWGRSREAFRRFRAKSPGWLLVCAVVLALSLVPLATGDLRAWLKENFTGPLLAGATALLGFLGKLRVYQAEAERGLEVVERAEQRVDAQLAKEQRRQNDRQSAAQKELSEANLRLLRFQEEEHALRQELARIEAENERISAGHQMREFILERSAGSNYRQYLGIVSTIRRDFEELQGVLESVQKEAAEAEASQQAADAAKAEKDAPVTTRPGGVANKVAIQRVVLYIDDLDRCPADRVVEVLQAVNLLLDFPLFVAVVAVDARWLLKSLAVHYAPQLGAHQTGTVLLPDTTWASTPQNFLEKIFQIPLTLRPMDAGGYRRLVRALVPVTEASNGAAKHQSDARTTAPGNGGAAVTSSKQQSASAGSPGGPSSGAEQPRGQHADTPQASTGSSTSANATAAHGKHGTNGSGDGRSPDSIDPNPTVLQITAHERDFLEELSSLISTPRSVKRLVNLYWLTRASLRQHEVTEFVGTPKLPGSYRTHLVLLALMVGYPTLSGMFFQALLERADTELETVVEQLAAAQEDQDPVTREEQDRFFDLVKGVAAAHALPTLASDYRVPAQRVMRFCFRAPRCSAAEVAESHGAHRSQNGARRPANAGAPLATVEA